MGRKKLGGKYKLGRTLGAGAFGKVKEGVSLKNNNQKVAIKIMNKAVIKKHNLIASVRMEVTALKLLPKHRHVVNLLEVLESDETLYLILELVQGGELFDKIKAEGKLSEQTARHYFRQLISGLEFMHRHKLCHRDLKLENLLIDSNGVLKITDFGLSGLRTDDDGEVFRTTLGSPNYVAPEVLNGKGYDGFLADIWSCGVILYALIAGFLPFDEENTTALFQKICTADFRYPQTFSSTLIDLLDRVLQVNPEKRSTIEGIKKHQWFQSQRPEDQYTSAEEQLIISPHVVSSIQVDDEIEKIETPRSTQQNMSGQFDWSDAELTHGSVPSGEFGSPLMISALSADDTFADPQSSDTGLPVVPERNHTKSRHGSRHSGSQQQPLALASAASDSAPLGPPPEKRNSLRVRIEPMYSAPMTRHRKSSSGYDKESVDKSDISSEASPSPIPSPCGFGFDSTPQSTPGCSPRLTPLVPISMTAFDLIGIVSTQMLNNVFTRSLKEERAIKTYTRFVSNEPPAKILWAIQESIRRMADCTSQVAADRFELYVKKEIVGGALINVNIKIFQTPANEYVVECRRQHGNVFHYHEWFDEFKATYEDVMTHIGKATHVDKSPLLKPLPKSRQKPSKNQKQFRKRTQPASTLSAPRAAANKNHHGRSSSDVSPLRLSPLEDLKEEPHSMTDMESEDGRNDNTLTPNFTDHATRANAGRGARVSQESVASTFSTQSAPMHSNRQHSHSVQASSSSNSSSQYTQNHSTPELRSSKSESDPPPMNSTFFNARSQSNASDASNNPTSQLTAPPSTHSAQNSVSSVSSNESINSVPVHIDNSATATVTGGTADTPTNHSATFPYNNSNASQPQSSEISNESSIHTSTDNHTATHTTTDNNSKNGHLNVP